MSRHSSGPEVPGPLTPAVLHVLLALAEGERHGYAIAREVETLTRGKVRMGPGTLYGTLLRLTETGLVEPVRTPAGSRGEDARRRFYRLTQGGRRALGLELQRLAGVVGQARKLGLLRNPEPA